MNQSLLHLSPANLFMRLPWVLSSVGAVASIVSPLLMTGMFGYFTRENAAIYAPEAPFYLAAVLDAIALGIFLYAMSRRKML